MNISQQDLKFLLEKAFEEGWNGCFDLKDESVDKIIEDYLEKSSNLGVTITTSFENNDSNYYYYCSPNSNTVGLDFNNEVI